ncbi:hypothetical protein BH11PLA2_BH11PLA2_36230 [soil metagenome]
MKYEFNEIAFGSTYGNQTASTGDFLWGHMSAKKSTSTSTLAVVVIEKAWVRVAIAKLEKIGRLKHDWDSYGGSPLDKKTQDSTYKLIMSIDDQELPNPHMELGSDGSVQMEWQKDNKELDFGIHGDSTVEFIKSYDDQIIETGSTGITIGDGVRPLTEWLANK